MAGILDNVTAVTELFVPDPTQLRIAAAGIVAWLALLGILRLVRSPKTPPPGPETTELGEEAPALVNLLVNDFKATRDAVPATLLDLAARGVVEIEDRGLSNYFCRVSPGTPGLTAYEDKLLGHLRGVAVDGVVPAEALTTGPQDESKRWWMAFRKEIVEEARAKGLSRNLWDGRTWAVLGVGAAFLAVAVGAATGFRDIEDMEQSALLTFVVNGFWVTVFSLIAVVTSTRQTDTPEGRRAAARWIGIRRALGRAPSFDVLPPTGVVVWERHLAYATAMGLAGRTVATLPMGAESDTSAWSAATGRWREVRVRYPRLRPGWGRHPLVALAVGALGTYFGLRLVGTASDADLTSAPLSWSWFFAVLAWIVALLVLTRSLTQLVRALPDLVLRRRIEGRILRCRTRWSPVPVPTQSDRQYCRFYIALDTGRSQDIRAFRVNARRFAEVRQGMDASFTVTPYLGYVSEVSAASPERRSSAEPGRAGP